MAGGSSKKGLGRGLSALMSDLKIDPVGGVAGKPGILSRPIELIAPNPDQPRNHFDEDSLHELAESIRQKGVLQPLIVRPIAGGTYEIVAGERRWRAAQLAGLHEVPVVERSFTDSEVLEVAIIENVQRADLNAMEEARGYKMLQDRFGHTQERIADALGRSRSHVANTMRLTTLPEPVQDMVRTGKLSAGHARALVTSDRALELAEAAVSRGLSVREMERLTRNMGRPATKADAKSAGKDADTRALEDDLSANLVMRVEIDHRPDGTGTMVLRYGSLDDLDFLCQVLGVADRRQI